MLIVVDQTSRFDLANDFLESLGESANLEEYPNLIIVRSTVEDVCVYQ